MRPDQELFTDIPSESIDYAVMERCPGSGVSIRVVSLDACWSDLGAWDAVWQVSQVDISGNATCGDVILKDTLNTFVYATNRLVATVGLENMVIIETPDAVLVADKNQAQHVKKNCTRA